MADGYGAQVTRVQFLRLVVALCTGTLIEWYDFTIFNSLSATITQQFFPATDAMKASLGYWSVWAIGFVARPVGSILFGHLGDTRGRRPTLLLSILCVSVPTILIGALPTHQQAGEAAPVLMAVMRLVQGLAVGGEFGSAIVYLWELAPHKRKGTMASLGQAAIAPGISLGLLVVMAVTYTCSPAQLALWGWRIPFLFSAITAPIALLLRMHMPEPYEYLASKEAMTLQRAAAVTADRVAASFVRHESRGCSRQHTRSLGLGPKQLAQRLASLTEVVFSGPQTQQATAVVDSRSQALTTAGSGTPQTNQLERVVSLPRLPSSSQHVPHVVLRVGTVNERPVSLVAHNKDSSCADDDAAWSNCQKEYIEELDVAAAAIKHHVPLQVLFVHHWLPVLLLTCLEAFYGLCFYIFFSWLPAYLHSPAVGLPPHAALAPLLLGMVLFGTAVGLCGRYLSDGRAPKLWTLLGIYAVLTALAPPALLWAARGSTASLWVVLPLALGSTGGAGAMFTSIGPSLFPAGVRASGYNFSHNLSISIFGGIGPIIITALTKAVSPPALAAAVVLLCCSAVSFAAVLPMARLAPHTTVCLPIGDAVVDSASLGGAATQGR